jgi:hypothetical protein
MAEVIIIEVDCDPALYPQVNGILGLDSVRTEPKQIAESWASTPAHRTWLDHPVIPTPDGPPRA